MRGKVEGKRGEFRNKREEQEKGVILRKRKKIEERKKRGIKRKKC